MNAIIIIFLLMLLGILIYIAIRVNKLINMLNGSFATLFKNIEILGNNQKQLSNSLVSLHSLLTSKLNKK